MMKHTIAELMMKLEGFRSLCYKDHLGNNTIGIGFNMDSKGSKEIWEKLIDPDFDKAYKGEIQIGLEDGIALLAPFWDNADYQVKQRIKELQNKGLVVMELNDMTAFKRFILKDIVFNTGNIQEWTKVLTETEDKKVMIEARRTQRELDSRIAKIAAAFDVIESVEEAVECGLTEAKYIV